MAGERSALRLDDIQRARQKFQYYLRMISKAANKSVTPEEAASFEKRNNDFYLETTLKDGRQIKLRTVFHAKEVNIEDHYGGIFKCSYHMMDTVNGLYKWLQDQPPLFTVDEIQKYADENNESYDSAKELIALRIADAEFWIRIEMAKFLHEQLEPTLKIVLSHLVEDAGLFGFSQYGMKFVNPKDIDRLSKDYVKLRKKRTNVIMGVGKRGKSVVSLEEFTEFTEQVFSKFRELEDAGRKITSNAVARKMISQNHSNPLKAFKDRLKKFDLTFDELSTEYSQRKSEQKNL
jgi:hypothetical protein